MKLNKKQKASIRAILALDPALLKSAKRLVAGSDPTVGLKISSRLAQARVRDYQRFLALRVLYPEQSLCPINADAMWHAHILDTRTYRADCLEIFGEFLHHDPNAVDVHLLATTTWELYLKTFSPGAWGKVDPTLKPLLLTADEVSLAKVHSVDCYTGHCGGA